MRRLLGFLQKVNQSILKLQGRPFFEAVRFLIIYLLVGVVWIVWSDKWLAAVVSDYETR